MNDDAINYNELANVDDGNCLFNDCTTDYWISNYGESVLDCNGNCTPVSWIGDGWCDDGAYGVVNEDGEEININLMCEEYNWDEGDCEAMPEGCAPGLIEDCNGICGPENWLGDGYCDDGSYQYNGNSIFFNCQELNNDNGDCNTLEKTSQQKPLPNGRIKIK